MENIALMAMGIGGLAFYMVLKLSKDVKYLREQVEEMKKQFPPALGR